MAQQQPAAQGLQPPPPQPALQQQGQGLQQPQAQAQAQPGQILQPPGAVGNVAAANANAGVAQGLGQQAFFNNPAFLQHHFAQAPGQPPLHGNLAFNPFLQGLPAFPPPGAGLLGAAPVFPPQAAANAAAAAPTANRDALLRLARQMAGEQSSSEDDGEEDDDEAGGPSEFDRQVARYRALSAVNPAQSFMAAASGSNVMGPEYLRSSVADASREQEIRDAENEMTSQDKKRQMRILKTFFFMHEDLQRLVAAGPGMLSVDRLDALRQSLGEDAFAANWDASRKTIREGIDKLRADIEREVSLLRLANDKGNKFGFATIERMKSLETLEKSLSKEDWDRFLRASTSMNQIKGKPARRGGGRGRGKKRKASGDQRPRFPKCAVCNKTGHVAGDAACKAAAK